MLFESPHGERGNSPNSAVPWIWPRCSPLNHRGHQLDLGAASEGEDHLNLVACFELAEWAGQLGAVRSGLEAGRPLSGHRDGRTGSVECLAIGSSDGHARRIRAGDRDERLVRAETVVDGEEEVRGCPRGGFLHPEIDDVERRGILRSAPGRRGD